MNLCVREWRYVVDWKEMKCPYDLRSRGFIMGLETLSSLVSLYINYNINFEFCKGDEQS